MDSSSAGAAGGMPPSSAGEEGPQQTYTAWDGTVFDDVRAFMKYEMETRYTFKGETGESETRLPGEIEGQPFDLIDLDDCEVQLLDCTDRIKVQHVRNSKVFVGACSSQVIVSHCRDCTFTLATREFYAHDTENCTFLLYCATPPEIEAATCQNLAFAPFNGRYEQLAENLAQAGLDPEENRWWEVVPIVASDSEAPMDVQQEVTVPEGCYRLMPEEEYAASVAPWEPLGECEPCIPPLWPDAAPPTATAAPAGAGGNGGLQAEEGEEEEDVHVVTSPDQLFPSSSSSLSTSQAKQQPQQQQPPPQPPLPPSSSTNTLLPAPFSAPTTPFSSHDGGASIGGSGSASTGRPGRAQSHPQPPLASAPREQRALSHQPTTTTAATTSSSSSSNSLVGLAGAGLGGSAAPSPFNSTRGAGSASAAASPFNSSSGVHHHRGVSGTVGVEEKKDGAPPVVSHVTAGGLQGREGTTLADFDYERWHAAWEERLRAKAEQEQRVEQEARSEAGRDLDAFYDRATDVKALRQERNREAEAATLAGIAASEATSDENPFKRVLELVGATDPGTGPDMSRFRGLMISLREEGLPAKPGMHRRLPTLGGGEDEELEGHGGRGDMGAAAAAASSSSSSSVRP